MEPPDSTTTTEPGATTEQPDASTTGNTTAEALQCLDIVNPGDPCGECACMECHDEMQACQEDPGCRAIRDCGKETGCSGIACLGPCGDVIQRNGGPFGPSGMLAQNIGTCVDAGCQVPCGAVQQCLAAVHPGDPCGECACTKCLDEMQACQKDAGCKAIRDCAAEAGCGGIDCLGPCGDVIQMNGGPFGPSGMLAQEIGTCVDMQCQGQC
ncbi:hypothetical protein [Nannocystis punicea]|uniref:Uncharacterized protein n=1 Tax=Nannocystis punicea TaxID=2995304 RepID=A0ABY7HBH6_9BACT|nr:hypothetical protein [Nannocystis poenicansa]WAS96455.1 hypothetical protein O0S08_09875 [Nannocystis poenicansa]